MWLRLRMQIIKNSVLSIHSCVDVLLKEALSIEGFCGLHYIILTVTATTLYKVDCQGRTYRYHTIAFSWQEAEHNCTAAGGSLLQTTNETQLFCADRLFQQPELMIDSTVTEIGSWVDSSGTASIMSELCPQWIASSNSVVRVNCSRPGPYICSMGKMISNSCCYYAYFKYFLIKALNGFEITCLTFTPPKIHFASNVEKQPAAPAAFKPGDFSLPRRCDIHYSRKNRHTHDISPTFLF